MLNITQTWHSTSMAKLCLVVTLLMLGLASCPCECLHAARLSVHLSELVASDVKSMLHGLTSDG